MLRGKTHKKAHKPTAKKAQQKKHKQQKRAYGTNVVFSADVDRVAQAAKYPLTKQSTLANGLRVATEQQDGQLATIGVFVDAGTRYEDESSNGTAHFLEHMLFKGTNKRSRTALELEIENMGGSLNAFTSREQTVFTATVQKKNIHNAIDLLGDILSESRITNQAIESERGVILEEMKSVAQDVQETVFDHLHATAYRQSSLAYTILGPAENIKKISRDDILNYVKTHYTGDRMAVAVVGDVEHADVAASVQKHFSKIPAQSTNGRKPNRGIANFIGSDFRLRDDDMPDCHVAVGFETAGWNDPDHYALMAFQMMLGNYSSARAMTDQHSNMELVQDLACSGMGDSVSPFNTIYSDTGIFGLYGVMAPNNVDMVVDDMIMAMIRPVFNVPQEQLNEAKNKLQLSLLAQYEGTETTCQELGRQLLTHGRRLHPVEVMHRIENVTQGDVQRVVKRFFYDQDFAISSVGNSFELQDYPFLRKKNTAGWF